MNSTPPGTRFRIFARDALAAVTISGVYFARNDSICVDGAAFDFPGCVAGPDFAVDTGLSYRTTVMAASPSGDLIVRSPSWKELLHHSRGATRRGRKPTFSDQSSAPGRRAPSVADRRRRIVPARGSRPAAMPWRAHEHKAVSPARRNPTRSAPPFSERASLRLRVLRRAAPSD